MQDIVQLEAEINSYGRIRSRIKWPQQTGPWIHGGLDDLLVQFTYAGWTAYRLNCAVGLALTYCDEELGQAVSGMLSNVIRAMGGVELTEIRLNKEAMDALERERLEP